MKRMLPVEELARDGRFNRIRVEDAVFDPRNASTRVNTLAPEYPNSSDNARGLMHGIFVGEIQALEGAGRTCWDFDTGDGRDEAPFALKLDMARQCWDEARHVESSASSPSRRFSMRRPATPIPCCASPASIARSRVSPSTCSPR